MWKAQTKQANLFFHPHIFRLVQNFLNIEINEIKIKLNEYSTSQNKNLCSLLILISTGSCNL